MTPAIRYPEANSLHAELGIGEGAPLATARLKDPRDYGDLFTHHSGKFILGADDDGNLQSFADDTGVFICGGPRSDKNAALSATICDWPGGLFHYTSKGNDASRLAPRRGRGNEYCSGLGQPTGILDFHRITQGVEEYIVSINPIDFIKAMNINCIALAYRVAICIIPLTGNESPNDYFSNDGRLCIAVIILWVAISHDYSGPRTLSAVYNLLQEGDVATFEELRAADLLDKDEHGNITATPFTVLWAGLGRCRDFNGLIKRRGAYLGQMRAIAGKQFVAVQSSIIVAMSFLDDPGVAEMLASTTFDLADLKFHPKGASLFICLEPGKSEYAVPAVRIIHALLEEVMKRPGSPATGHKTLIWLDELPTLRLDVLNTMAEWPSYGAKPVVMVQSVSQLTLPPPRGYGENGVHIFFASCATRVYMDIRSAFDAELILRMAGEHEVIALNQSGSLAHSTTRAIAEGTSDQDTTNWSDTSGTTRGENESSGVNDSISLTDNFMAKLRQYVLPHLLVKAIAILGLVFGSRWNRSRSRQRGVTLTTGTQTTTAKSLTEGGGHSKGTSQTTTNSEGDTRTGTVTEQRQVRPLLSLPDIINRYSKHNPEGRRVLIDVCGIGFFELWRVRYWEHEYFFTKHGKDPDFEFKTTKPAALLERERLIAQLPAMRSEVAALRAANGTVDEYKLLLNGMHATSLFGVAALILAGGWFLAPIPLAGHYICRGIRYRRDERTERIRTLQQQITEAEAY